MNRCEIEVLLETKETNMADKELLQARYQLAKVRELRKEIRKMDSTLTHLELSLATGIAQLERGKYPDAKSLDLTTGPLTGWLDSMLESYIAIAYAIGANTGRRLASDLSSFISRQREREEQIVARDQAEFWRKQGLSR